MDIKNLKLEFENLYVKALNIDISIRQHPLVLLEAVKSLVGIKLAVDCKKILIELKAFITKYPAAYSDIDSNNELKIPDVISFVDLKQSLIDKNDKKVKKNIFYLSRVSDGRQILEFLLEFSLEYNSFYVHQYIWAVYRMELFLNNKFINISLNRVCEKILQSEYRVLSKESKESKEINWNTLFNSYGLNFSKTSLYYSISKTDLIRQAKIKQILHLIDGLKIEEDIENIKYEYLHDQILLDREWIHTFLLNNNKLIDYTYLINLNSCRSCLKLSDDIDPRLFWTHLNNLIGVSCN